MFRWVKHALFISGLSAFLCAGDFDAMLEAVQRTWPERTTAAAICSVEYSQAALLELIDAAKVRGISLFVVNIRHAKEFDGILNAVFARKPGFMVLIDDDALLGAKSPQAKTLIVRAANHRIPTSCLTEEGMKLGAVFAIGPMTHNKILGNMEFAKRLGVPIPDDLPQEGDSEVK